MRDLEPPAYWRALADAIDAVTCGRSNYGLWDPDLLIKSSCGGCHIGYLGEVVSAVFAKHMFTLRTEERAALADIFRAWGEE